METDHFTFLLLRWERNLMKTLISIPHAAPNEWKVETVSAAEAGKLGDLYLEVSSSVANQNKFFTDSNGWLVMQRELFKHEDYEAYFSPNKLDDINGNSYPVTAFIYIEDAVEKVSVNTDRPQGGIVYKPGTIWLNFDRLTSDDGKWVFETTYRSEYQRFTHFVTVQNKNGNERIIQQRYDQPRFVIGTVAYSNAVREDDKERQKVWQRVAGFQ